MNPPRNWKAESIAGNWASRPVVRAGPSLSTPIQLLLLAASLGAGSVLPLCAQLVNDGATITLANVTNAFTGDVTVGTNGSFTLLVLSNNALLTNSANGNVGLNSTAKSNEVRLASPTARWFMGNNLFVGNNGSFSRLVVSNGASVRNNTGFVGPNVPSSNNVAVVTGPGSLWSNANVFYLGFSGAGNQLIVSNGGVLRNNAGTIGVNGGSSNNLAMVTGSGSLWSNASTLQLGFSGAGNLLVVSNGGFVRSSVGAMGSQPSGSNTVAVVTGTGSTWSNAAELYVGNSSASNLLLVGAGGTVRNGHGYVGANFTASNNLALVTDAGSTWSNALDLNIGAFSANNRMIVSNGATVFAAGHGVIGPTANGNGNSAMVTDSGSHWLLGNNLYAGSNGALSRLTISNGGLVADRSGLIGYNVSSSNNLAMVTGSGSVWSNASEIRVGHFGAGNQLVVSNGGFVSAESGEIGSEVGSANNQVTVIGFGSKWSNTNILYVGNYGVGNRLVIADGGAVHSSNGHIGSNPSSSNNLAVVVDAGSVWSNANPLFVGSAGAGNQVVVSNGAAVFGSEGVIGYTSSSSNNLAVVTGAGSMWSNAVDLFVGNDGRNNQLIVSNGGRMQGQVGTVGLNASSSNNLVVVTGAGSLWTNDQALFIGNSGGGNSLVVSNGGTVSSSDGIIGLNSTSDNNVALVTVTGSSWNMAGDLAVGFAGDANRLVVSNSGRVLNNFGVLLSHSNEVVVTGTGSLWSNRFDVIVGGLGRGNRLVVNSGGTVLGANAFVGQEPTATNNRVVVDAGTLRVTNGAGTGVLDIRRGTNVLNAGLMDVDQLMMTNALSRFEFNGGTLITRGAAISNHSSPFVVGNTGGVPAVWDVRAGAGNHFVSGEIYVGGTAPFAQLMLTNGALLTNDGYALVGAQANSHSNTVTLAGSGSRWWLGDGVIVGSGGSANRLMVRDGASLVTASISYFGDTTSSSNNEAVVTGPGSSWFTASFGLRVGDEGRANRLLVSDGGVVTSFDDWIGVNSSSSNNQVLVTGAGSLWNNTRELAVGFKSTGNELVVSNGAALFTGGRAMLGAGTNAARNAALVTGPGSSWLINSNLFVGSNGSLCHLVISNGALAVSEFGTLGVGASSSNNFATVAGPGAAWNIIESLEVGRSGRGNQLLVTDGARLSTKSVMLGSANVSSGNSVLVRGAGTLWTNTSALRIGGSGSGNRLTVADGARIECEFGSVGTGSSSRSNEVVVSGPDSLWRVEQFLSIGEFGGANRLVITNGGRLVASGEIGGSGSSSNNEVVVTGPGSTWTASSTLFVGGAGSGNRLVIRDGGEVIQDSVGLTLGASIASLSNRLLVDAGSLRLINPNLGLGVLDLRRGTNVLNAGLIEAQQLLLTNAQGFFEFNGGVLAIGNSAIRNGQQFRVGNGVSPATLVLAGDGNGFHAFDPPANLTISMNGKLAGNGTISGGLTVQAGGLLSPGVSIGSISVTPIASPVLQGTVLMEISKTGPALTNDALQVTLVGPFNYGGTLVVTNLGPDALAAGDRFRLFVAGGYSGSFSNLTLPPLASGLTWRNDLAVDGSISVVATLSPGFSVISLAGTNLILAGTNGPPNANYSVLAATNVALPLSDWVSLVTNQFDIAGNFRFTNSIVPGIPQRFFRLEVQENPGTQD